MSLIKVENLTKDYGYGRSVFDVSFEINELLLKMKQEELQVDVTIES